MEVHKVLTSSASGLAQIVQLTAIPSNQSMIGGRYTVPVGICNSVMSVNYFSSGAAAWKRRLMKVSGAGLISPRYDSYCSCGQAREISRLPSKAAILGESDGSERLRLGTARTGFPHRIRVGFLNGEIDALAQQQYPWIGQRRVLWPSLPPQYF